MDPYKTEQVETLQSERPNTTYVNIPVVSSKTETVDVDRPVLYKQLERKGVPLHVLEAISKDEEIDRSIPPEAQEFSVVGRFHAVRSMVAAEETLGLPIQAYEFAQGCVDNGFETDTEGWEPPVVTVQDKGGRNHRYSSNLPNDTKVISFRNNGKLNMSELLNLGSKTALSTSDNKLGGYGQGFRVALMAYLATSTDKANLLDDLSKASSVPFYDRPKYKEAAKKLREKPEVGQDKYAVVQSKDPKFGPYKIYCYRIHVEEDDQEFNDTWKMGFVICKTDQTMLSAEKQNTVVMELHNPDSSTIQLYGDAAEHFLYLNQNYTSDKSLVGASPGARVEEGISTHSYEITTTNYGYKANYQVVMLKGVTKEPGIFLNGLRLEPSGAFKHVLDVSWDIRPLNSNARSRTYRSSDSMKIVGEHETLIREALAECRDVDIWEKVFRQAIEIKRPSDEYVELRPKIPNDAKFLERTHPIREAFARINPQINQQRTKENSFTPDFLTSEDDFRLLKLLIAEWGSDDSDFIPENLLYLSQEWKELNRALRAVGLYGSETYMRHQVKLLIESHYTKTLESVGHYIPTDSQYRTLLSADYHPESTSEFDIIRDSLELQTNLRLISQKEKSNKSLTIWFTLPEHAVEVLDREMYSPGSSLKNQSSDVAKILNCIRKLTEKGMKTTLDIVTDNRIGTIGVLPLKTSVILWNETPLTRYAAKGITHSLTVTGDPKKISVLKKELETIEIRIDQTDPLTTDKSVQEAVQEQALMDNKAELIAQIEALESQKREAEAQLHAQLKRGKNLKHTLQQSVEFDPDKQHLGLPDREKEEYADSLGVIIPFSTSSAFLSGPFSSSPQNNLDTLNSARSELGERPRHSSPHYVYHWYTNDKPDFYPLNTTDSVRLLTDGTLISYRSATDIVDAARDKNGDSKWYLSEKYEPAYDITQLENCIGFVELPRPLYINRNDAASIPISGEFEIICIQIPESAFSSQIDKPPFLQYDRLNDQYMFVLTDVKGELNRIPEGTRIYIGPKNSKRVLNESWIATHFPDYLERISASDLQPTLIEDINIRSMLYELRDRNDLSREEKVDVILALTDRIFLYDEMYEPHSAEETINLGRGVCRHFARAVEQMVRFVGVPARVKNGYPDSSERGFLQPPYHAQVEFIDSKGQMRLANPRVAGLHQEFGLDISKHLVQGHIPNLHEIGSLASMLKSKAAAAISDVLHEISISRILKNIEVRQHVNSPNSLVRAITTVRDQGSSSDILAQLAALRDMFIPQPEAVVGEKQRLTIIPPEQAEDINERLSTTMSEFMAILIALTATDSIDSQTSRRARLFLHQAMAVAFESELQLFNPTGQKSIIINKETKSTSKKRRRTYREDPLREIKPLLSRSAAINLEFILKSGKISSGSIESMCNTFLSDVTTKGSLLGQLRTSGRRKEKVQRLEAFLSNLANLLN